MSDIPADPTPEQSSADAGAGTAAATKPPLPTGDRLSLAEVVRIIEDRKQTNLAEDETERPKFLRALQKGEFPAPIEPKGRLPRDKKGGDVNWSDCYWSAKDIHAWLDGKLTKDDWVQSWHSHKIKDNRDLPALASYAARRIIRGDYEWEHWSDAYQPRAYAGKFMSWVVWASLIGYLCFGILAQLADPLFEKDDEGNFVSVGENIFEYRDPETKEIKWAIRATGGDRGGEVFYDYGDAYRGSRDGEAGSVPIIGFPDYTRAMVVEERHLLRMRDDSGQRVFRPARRFQYRTDSDGEVVRIDAEGQERPIPGSWLQRQPEASKYLYGIREYPFLSFMAADLSGTTGIPFFTVPMVIFLVVAVIPFLFSLSRFLQAWLSLRYSLTDQRLIMREGVLHRRERQIRVVQIQDLTVELGPIQRLLGVGDVMVSSPDDADTPEYVIRGVRHPLAVKDRIFAVSEVAKSDKRYYVEAGARAGRR